MNPSKSKNQQAVIIATPNMNPGDEAPAGTPGTGEKPCEKCGGSGKDEVGKPCVACGATGFITAGIGGA